MSDWVNEFVTKHKETSDTNKRMMIDIVPMVFKMLERVNPKLGTINVSAVEVNGVKAITILFLEEG